jgi:hypothetical protein
MTVGKLVHWRWHKSSEVRFKKESKVITKSRPEGRKRKMWHILGSSSVKSGYIYINAFLLLQ